MTNANSSSTMASRIEAARKAAGMSWDRVALEVAQHLPRAMWLTPERLRHYGTGRVVEKDADPLVILALAKVFNVEPSQLLPGIEAYLDKIRDLVLSS